MYCENCGAEIDKEAYVCPKCGVKVNKEEENIVEDKPNVGLNILAVLFPIVGIILYFVWKNNTPKKAKSILTCGLVGWGVAILLNIITTMLG